MLQAPACKPGAANACFCSSWLHLHASQAPRDSPRALGGLQRQCPLGDSPLQFVFATPRKPMPEMKALGLHTSTEKDKLIAVAKDCHR